MCLSVCLSPNMAYHTVYCLTPVPANIVTTSFLNPWYVFTGLAMHVYRRKSFRAALLHRQQRGYARRLLAFHWRTYTTILVYLAVAFNVMAYLLTSDSSKVVNTDFSAFIPTGRYPRAVLTQARARLPERVLRSRCNLPAWLGCGAHVLLGHLQRTLVLRTDTCSLSQHPATARAPPY